MFWDSLREGADILTYWRFWAVALSYGALGLVPLLLAGMLGEKRLGSSFVVMMVSAVIWPVVILTGTILLLAPLMLGRVNVIAWEFLGQYSIGQIAMIGGVAFVAGILIAIVPIIGQFNAVVGFIQVAVMLGLLTSALTGGQAEVWPGWLMALGLAATGGIIAHVLGVVVAVAAFAALGEEREGLVVLVVNPVTALTSLLPGCFYAGWLRVANGF